VFHQTLIYQSKGKRKPSSGDPIDLKDLPISLAAFANGGDYAKFSPRFSAVLKRSDQDDVGMEDIDALQMELEAMLSLTVVRKTTLKEELDVLYDIGKYEGHGKFNRKNLVTSTSATVSNSNSDGKEEYLSREERIFQRQLESAIEMSRKTAIESASSGSELSQEQGLKVVLKRKSFDEDYTVTPTRKAKTRKLISSDEDSDDEFVGFKTDKKKPPPKKIEEKKQPDTKSNKQNNPPKKVDLASIEESKSLELKVKNPQSNLNNLENEKPVKIDEIKPNKNICNTKSEVINDQTVKTSNKKKDHKRCRR